MSMRRRDFLRDVARVGGAALGYEVASRVMPVLDAYASQDGVVTLDRVLAHLREFPQISEYHLSWASCYDLKRTKGWFFNVEVNLLGDIPEDLTVRKSSEKGELTWSGYDGGKKGVFLDSSGRIVHTVSTATPSGSGFVERTVPSRVIYSLYDFGMADLRLDYATKTTISRNEEEGSEIQTVHRQTPESEDLVYLSEVLREFLRSNPKNYEV